MSELKIALNDFQVAVVNWTRSSSQETVDSMVAARTRIEQLFEEANGKVVLTDPLTKQEMELSAIEGVRVLSLALGNLRSQTLTAEEAQWLTTKWVDHNWDKDCICVTCEDLTLKLRSISKALPKEEQE